MWTWRGWRDPARQVGVAERILSVAESVRDTQAVRGWAADQRDDGATWPTTWSSSATLQHEWLSIDARDDAASPVYATYEANLTEEPQLVAASLGDLFEHWTEQLVLGHVRYDSGVWRASDKHEAYPAS